MYRYFLEIIRPNKNMYLEVSYDTLRAAFIALPYRNDRTIRINHIYIYIYKIWTKDYYAVKIDIKILGRKRKLQIE